MKVEAASFAVYFEERCQAHPQKSPKTRTGAEKTHLSIAKRRRLPLIPCTLLYHKKIKIYAIKILGKLCIIRKTIRASMSMKDHFQGKTALLHLADVRASQAGSSLEVHGAEMPGPLFAFFDAARQSLVVYLLLFAVVQWGGLSMDKAFFGFVPFTVGWIFWSGARSTLLAWYRLNRLHAIASEEREEIDTNRSQEREELIALYSLKGFSGPLLDKVVEVLMADKDRLLKVMLQEEMGFRLEEYPHPLVQGLCAAFGAALASFLVVLAHIGCPVFFLMAIAIVLVSLIGALCARFERTPQIPACIWNLSISVVCVVITRMCLLLYTY